MVLHKINI